ncbi:hypothetical protein [Kitasatospora sp. NPDC098663]|uniref:hypothetical protein n=1 Tax=Kitasatospora sp. NPDC098663 TaxID=3364096 RepID=UPI0037F81DB8
MQADSVGGISISQLPVSEAVSGRRADLYIATAERLRDLEACFILAFGPARLVEDCGDDSYPSAYFRAQRYLIGSWPTYQILDPDWLFRYIAVTSLVAALPHRVLAGKDPIDEFEQRITMFAEHRRNFQRMANLALNDPAFAVNRSDDLLPTPLPRRKGDTRTALSIQHSDWVTGTTRPLPSGRSQD